MRHEEEELLFECPYCGEMNSIAADPSGGEVQKMISDCEVCCRPINMTIRFINPDDVDANDEELSAHIEVSRDDE